MSSSTFEYLLTPSTPTFDLFLPLSSATATASKTNDAIAMPCTPPASASPSTSAWPTSPDDLFSSAGSVSWSTPFSIPAMPSLSDNSSPVDFAFEPPRTDKLQQQPPQQQQPNMNPSPNPLSFSFNGLPYFSSASSFSSSTTGSVGGGSFSSADALPAISRDFARPSPTETRRPATAGGALQSRSPLTGFTEGDRFQRLRGSSTKPETIDENAEGVFTNPFTSPISEKQTTQPADVVDPRFVPTSSRRASEPQFQGWTPQQSPMTAPPNVGQFVPMQQPQQPMQSMHTHNQQLQRPAPPIFPTSRPQTSDGLPSYSGVGLGSQAPLPSARTLVNQIDNSYHLAQGSSYLMPFRDTRASMPEAVPTYHHSQNSFPGDRSYSLGSKPSSQLTFVPLGGPTPKKRPRRRFDEIERLYGCGFNGCEKSYGTLNHLNAHVAMQKHGEKRLPSEFKEMRKTWRKKKRDSIAAQANSGQYGSEAGWAQPRTSISSATTDGSEYDDRRDSLSSDYSSSRAGSFAQPSAQTYGAWESARPSTSSSVGSSTDTRSYLPTNVGAYQPSTYSHGLVNAVPASARRASAPQHVMLPSHPSQGLMAGFRPNEGDHPTPTQQNPNPFPLGGIRQGYQGQQQQQQQQQQGGQFAFQTLTSPVSVQGGGSFGQQFAFQR